MSEQEYRCGIRNAGNTLIPCLQAIAAKGYSIDHYFLSDSPDDFSKPQWDAEKEGRHFSATSPQELLGLIAMWEARGDEWQIRDGDSELYDELVNAAQVYDDQGQQLKPDRSE